MISAAFILGAIESKYPRAVMVPELSINDPAQISVLTGTSQSAVLMR